MKNIRNGVKLSCFRAIWANRRQAERLVDEMSWNLMKSERQASFR